MAIINGSEFAIRFPKHMTNYVNKLISLFAVFLIGLTTGNIVQKFVWYSLLYGLNYQQLHFLAYYSVSHLHVFYLLHMHCSFYFWWRHFWITCNTTIAQRNIIATLSLGYLFIRYPIIKAIPTIYRTTTISISSLLTLPENNPRLRRSNLLLLFICY